MNDMPIYLDYMATTPIDPRVIEKMLGYMGKEGIFGNPASTTHIYGQQAQIAIEQAREQIAATIGAHPREIIFTSGATEANNLAIIGAARFYQRKGRHLITMTTEHKAVLDSFAQLEKEGFNITYLKPDAQGLLDIQRLEEVITAETILVSIMHVNNEIGVIQDIATIGEMLKDRGIIFHVDAAQSAGKLAIDLSQHAIELMSFSAHKNYGPKGVGALFVRQKPRIRLQPLSYGGGHEAGLRSGTLATHQIVGMAEAFYLAEQNRSEEQERILALRELLWKKINTIPGIKLNGSYSQRVAGNLNICFKGIEGDSILLALRQLAISSTSACAAATMQPSYVLRSIGLDNEEALSSIRLSVGRFTTKSEIEYTGELIYQQINRLYGIAP